MKICFAVLAAAGWLVASCPSWAGDRNGRFLEFQSGNDTHTYDLNTVQVIQPDRFTIVSTRIDNPDVMKFKLTALNTLYAYCARADGQYPAPANLLMLGPPDMPVKSIDVISGGKKAKKIMWLYPYKRLAVFSMKEGSWKQALGWFMCLGSASEDQ